MRRAEFKISSLFALVKTDYIENGYKLAILTANLKHLSPCFNDQYAERLASSDIEQYKVEREQAGAAKTTIRLELNTLRRAYTLGLERGLVRSAPKITGYSKQLLTKNKRRGFFERDELDRLLVTCLPYQAHCLRFAYLCGWRESEMFNLTWTENYVSEPPHVRIYASKNGDGRVLPLVGDLLAVVNERLLVHGGQNCPFIFHFGGHKLNRSTFNKHWRQACVKAGVKHYFHDLRRTASRNLRNAGVDQAERMAIIGHRSPTMDLYYSIVDESNIRDALNKVVCQGV